MEEFWELINPTNPLGKKFSQEECDKILYRGQSDSKWGLAPSALRGFENYEIIPISEFRKTIVKEFEKLKKYFNNPIVRTQMPKGTGYIDLQDDFANINTEVFFNDLDNLMYWPLKKYEPLSAYVQHMRTHTSLLDWTKYAYVAVFFASYGHMIGDGKLDKTKEIAIWIYLNEGNNPARIKVISPLTDERNINAQFGSFVSIKQEIKDVNEIEFQTLETLSDESNLYKITIDKKYCPTLLKYCHNHFINLASLHPSDNSFVTKSDEIESKWREELQQREEMQTILDLSADIEVKND